MCRSIKVLRRPDLVASEDEIAAAALQFVRKISGFHKPSQANQAAFDAAVLEIAQTSGRLLDQLSQRSHKAAVKEALILKE
ncbi:MAG TPA: DUF2277 domain-containing protein [Bryobacteraceae bacterium]|jgi:hypothetical protein